MNSKEIVHKVMEKTLLEHGFVLKQKPVKWLYLEYENISENSSIIINRGPTKYLRIMYQKGRLGFGLDSFDSELNLQYDIEYNTVADLKKVLEYYLSVTISHALPLLSRLPYPVPEVTHENQKKFATDTMGKAASWAVPLALSCT